MKSTDAPSLITTAFAQNGTRNDIPASDPGFSGDDAGRAAFATGFPDITMRPITAGGKPPFGADFNGILYALSNAARYYGAGGHYRFNGSFAAAIGGYPIGATVQASDGMGHWLNVVDANGTDPESSLSTGWIPLSDHNGTATVNLTGSVALSASQAAKANIRLTGNIKGNLTVTFPAWTKRYSIINDCTGDQSVICTTGNGESISIKNGAKYEIGCDGKNLTVATVNASQVFAEPNKNVSSLEAPTVQQIINALGAAASHGFFDTGDAEKIPFGGADAASTGCVAAVRDYAKSINDSIRNSLKPIATSGYLNDGMGVLDISHGGTGRSDGKLDTDTVYINSGNGYEGIIFKASPGGELYSNKIVAGEDNSTDMNKLGNVAFHSWNGFSFGTVDSGTKFLIDARNGDTRQAGSLILTGNGIFKSHADAGAIIEDASSWRLYVQGSLLYQRSPDGYVALSFKDGRMTRGTVPASSIVDSGDALYANVFDADFGATWQDLPFEGKAKILSTGAAHNIFSKLVGSLGESAFKPLFDGNISDSPDGAAAAVSTGTAKGMDSYAKYLGKRIDHISAPGEVGSSVMARVTGGDANAEYNLGDKIQGEYLTACSSNGETGAGKRLEGMWKCSGHAIHSSKSWQSSTTTWVRYL